jgi:hypothetical protein
MINQLSKQLIFTPCYKTATAKNIAYMFINQVYCYYNIINHVKIQIITHTLSHVLNYNKPPLKHASDGSHALQLALKQ